MSLVRLGAIWITNHPPSVLWHCWLGHLTSKNVVSEMTWTVSSGTLNIAQPTNLPGNDVSAATLLVLSCWFCVPSSWFTSFIYTRPSQSLLVCFCLLLWLSRIWTHTLPQCKLGYIFINCTNLTVVALYVHIVISLPIKSLMFVISIG